MEVKAVCEEKRYGKRVKELHDGSCLLLQIEVFGDIQLLAGSGDGRIYPLVVAGLLICRQLARYVKEHVVPLATLRLVARQGIAVDGAQGVKIGVGQHLTVELIRLLAHAKILHAVIEVDEELFLLRRREVGLVGVEDVGYQKLGVFLARGELVVGHFVERQSGAFLLYLHAVDDYLVAVHHARDVVVLCDEQQVALLKLRRMEAQSGAHEARHRVALAVGTADKGGVVVAVFLDALDVHLHEFHRGAFHVDVAIAEQGELGPIFSLRMLVELAQAAGGEQDVVVGGLALHVGERGLNGLLAELLLDVAGGDGWRDALAYGRQLTVVADEDELAEGVVAEQVGEQATAAEAGLHWRLLLDVGNHGGLIHEVYRSRLRIYRRKPEVQEQLSGGVHARLLALRRHLVEVLVEAGVFVYASMHGARLLASLVAQHLGGASRRGEQPVWHAHLLELRYHLLYEGRLSRSGVAAEDEHAARAAHKLQEARHSATLVVGELQLLG